MKKITISLERRHFIRLMGRCSIVSLPLLCGCSINSTEIKSTAHPREDPRYRWLAVASLAPSSHNMQPWKVDISSRTDLLLYTDDRYLLKKSDPESRQTMISLGGFIELLSMAAQAEGFCCDINLFPCGEEPSKPVAQICIKKNNMKRTTDSLLLFAKSRRTNRREYLRDRLLTGERLSLLEAEGNSHGMLCHGTLQAQKVNTLNKLATLAWLTEIRDPDHVMEMLSVTRIGRKEISLYRDGVAIQGLLPELAATLGIYSRDRLPAEDSIVMKNMQAMGEKQAMSAAGWIWIISPNNTRIKQIAAGRAFIRLHLRATQLGVALQPMSQGLEDYPPMSEHREALFRELGAQGSQTVQMLARLGYAVEELPTLRRPVSTFLDCQKS